MLSFGGDNKHTCPSLDKNFTHFWFDFLGLLGKNFTKKRLLFVSEKGNFKRIFMKRRYLEFKNFCLSERERERERERVL